MGGAFGSRRRRLVKPHLLLRLEGPLMAFGGVAVDAHGPVLAIPSASALAGLIGNALGWLRSDYDHLGRLQRRLRYAVRRDREGERVRDFQTVQLSKEDKAWTTRGEPFGRSGGIATYDNAHIRLRWYDADASLTVALRLEDAEEEPALDRVAESLARPARPLFLGRKPCMPSLPLVAGIVEADSCFEALTACPRAHDGAPTSRVFWMAGEGPANGVRHEIAGLRDWPNDVHVGRQVFFEGAVSGRGAA